MSMIGKTLAHYEITGHFGKGGMGEVYQAKDRKLGRDVAIKVLPEEFARDADRDLIPNGGDVPLVQLFQSALCSRRQEQR